MSRDVTSLSLDSIVVGERLRAVDPDRALYLAANIDQEGLKTPIEVRPIGKSGKYGLIVGAHRLEAVRLLGRAVIEVLVLDITPDQAKMREIDENLYRIDLSELERAVFIAEKKAIYEKMHPQVRHGGDRKSDQAAIFGGLIARFTEEVREKLGCSERTLQRIVARAKIAPDVRARIALTPIARNGSELDALVRLKPDEQAQAVDLLLSGDDDAPRTVAAAARLVRGERPAAVEPVDVSDRELADLLGAFRRAGAKARNAFIENEAVASFLASRGYVLDGEDREAA